MAERPQPYSSLSPQLSLYNPGYDPTGDDPPKYEDLSHLATQQDPGQYAPGQYMAFNRYPVLQQPTVSTHVNVPTGSTTSVVKLIPRRDLRWDAGWVCLCCFWNIGCCALHYATKAENSYVTGDFAKAEVYRRRSALFIRVAVFIGSFVAISIIIAVVLSAAN